MYNPQVDKHYSSYCCMKRDKKGIKEKPVKWINRIVSKENEKDKDKKQR